MEKFIRIYQIFVCIFALSSICLACFPGGRLIRRLPKSAPPLIYKQHFPNLPENALTASGPREGRIRKGDKRYQELVVNRNPDIIFRDEEGTGEDRIMSMRCKEKLDTLSMLVMNYWSRSGVKLYVREAWDQDNIHAPDSLHYEGRAVDILTSDRDRNKIGMLARLAVQAGFDWVYYQNRFHVHASVKSDAVTRHKRVLKCFPGHATVLTESGARTSLSSVRIGERVAVSDIDNYERARFEPIISFLHYDANATSQFVEILTENGRKLIASAEHLVYYVSSNDYAILRNNFAISVKPTAQLKLGDFLMVARGKNGKTERVTSVRTVYGKGLYAPLTHSGTLFVDDVLTSCYAAVKSERLAHVVFSPLRLWYRLKETFFGSPNRRDIEWKGVHWYADWLWRVAEYMESVGLWQFFDDTY